jgi:5-methyltetrahydropteroyltriglutamate--homocysteine methyltransferase
LHFYRCTDFADQAAYQTAESFFADLTRIYRDEIAPLAAAGCRYIQLDEVALALLCDPAIRTKVETAGENPDYLADLYIESVDEAVSGAPFRLNAVSPPPSRVIQLRRRTK